MVLTRGRKEARKHYFQRSGHLIVYKYKYDFLAPTTFFLFIFTIIQICVIS